MLVTDLEAKEKVCTHIPPTSYTYKNYTSEYVSVPSSGSGDHFRPSYGYNVHRENNSNTSFTPAKCLGSGCIHWEWNFQPDDVSHEAQLERDKYGGNGRGRCGRDSGKVIVV